MSTPIVASLFNLSAVGQSSTPAISAPTVYHLVQSRSQDLQCQYVLPRRHARGLFFKSPKDMYLWESKKTLAVLPWRLILARALLVPGRPIRALASDGFVVVRS
jgi:hypothetical protein